MPNEPWLVIHAVSPSEELVSLLTEGLIASGGSAVQEDGPRLTTWVSGRPDPAAFVDEVRERLEGIAGQPVPVAWEQRADEDWTATWRKGLGARRVGRRIVIAPSWSTTDAGDGDIQVIIDPQMAFGTGEHASTRGVLRLLEDAIDPGAQVLDAGTGSAVLAIVAARLGAARILAVDFDEDALLNARENVLRNRCGDRVDLRQATVDARWIDGLARSFDVITANILSGVLLPLLPAFRGALRASGALIVGGILIEEAETMVVAADAAGLRLVREDREEDWWSARFTS